MTPFETSIIEMLISYESVPRDERSFAEQIVELADKPDMLEPRWLCNQPVPEMLTPIIEALLDEEQHVLNPIDEAAGDERERLALWLESWSERIWDGKEREGYGWARAVAFAVREDVRMEMLNCVGRWDEQRLRKKVGERGAK